MVLIIKFVIQSGISIKVTINDILNTLYLFNKILKVNSYTSRLSILFYMALNRKSYALILFF